jgi:hypothetical protein
MGNTLMGYISRSCDLLRGGISKKGNLIDYVSRDFCSKNPEKLMFGGACVGKALW